MARQPYLSEPGARALRGLGRVHSLALDAHKWLFQPIECGCVLVRERQWLQRTFAASGEYLKDMEQPGEEKKLWLSGHPADTPVPRLESCG